MVTIKQIDPPAKFKPQGIGEPVIGVRILVLRDAGTPYFYPEHNRTGREMLCRLLEARMELSGVRVTEIAQGLELNRAYYIFTVSEITPAQEVVREELAKLGMLDWAQIAWRDPREEIWRVLWSKSGRFDPPSDEELEIEIRFLDGMIEARKKFQQSEDESPGQ